MQDDPRIPSVQRRSRFLALRLRFLGGRASEALLLSLPQLAAANTLEIAMRPMFSPLPLSRPLPRRPSPAPARCSRKRRSRPTICVGRGPAGPGPHSPLPVRLTSMMAKQTESISMASRVPSPYLQHAFGDWPHSPIPVHGRRSAPRGGGSAPQPAGLFSHVVGFRAAAARAGGVYTLAGLAEPA